MCKRSLAWPRNSLHVFTVMSWNTASENNISLINITLISALESVAWICLKYNYNAETFCVPYTPFWNVNKCSTSLLLKPNAKPSIDSTAVLKTAVRTATSYRTFCQKGHWQFSFLTTHIIITIQTGLYVPFHTYEKTSLEFWVLLDCHSVAEIRNLR